VHVGASDGADGADDRLAGSEFGEPAGGFCAAGFFVWGEFIFHVGGSIWGQGAWVSAAGDEFIYCGGERAFVIHAVHAGADSGDVSSVLSALHPSQVAMGGEKRFDYVGLSLGRGLVWGTAERVVKQQVSRERLAQVSE